VFSGQFTPIAGRHYGGQNWEYLSPFQFVHFFPKNGNKIIIAGQEETIPPGVGVTSGGVIGDVENASIDRAPGQRLQPNTTYRTFVYMDGGDMKMDFSTGGHKEDQTYGNQVHVADPARSLVGMVRTNETGRIYGDATRQNTISWFNRGHTGLGSFIGWGGGNPVSITPTHPGWHDTGYSLEFLTFGINDTFRQAFTVPNVHFSGMIGNDAMGGVACVGLEFNGSVFSHQPWCYQAVPGQGYHVHDVALGAGAADEGHVKVKLVISNLGYGSTVHIHRGSLYLDPLHS
jgi:hypothetical protein